VESSQGKTVWKSGVALGPLLFLILYRLKARRPASVELFEKSQCVRQIGELIHEVYLRQECMPHVSKLRLVPQPSGKRFAPSGGDFVNDASGAALGGRAAGSQQVPLLQPFQAWIDLAQFGGPEMSDPVVQDGLQVVSAGGLAEQAKQNMFETHAHHYISCYINFNSCLQGPATRRFPDFCRNGAEPFWGPALQGQSSTRAEGESELACARRCGHTDSSARCGGPQNDKKGRGESVSAQTHFQAKDLRQSRRARLRRRAFSLGSE
jgi:hypothetical protein